MVNPGHRSFGCAPCRVAKVKCDEGRPSCRRCVRMKRICSGYQYVAPRLRLMNDTSGNKVQWRVRERLESRPPVRASSATIPDDQFLPPRQTTPTPWNPLSTDWTIQSVKIFFAEHVLGPDFLHSTWGSWEYLPSLYDKARTTHLTEAVHAAALANLAHITSVSELEQMARQAYGKGLLSLGQAMNNPSRIADNETLAAMNVLAMYEVLAGQRPLTELFHAHFYGQSTILHIQKHKGAYGNTLFGATNRTLMWRDLAVKSRPFLCVSDWPTSTYSSSLGEASAQLTLRIVEICGRAKEASDQQVDADGTWITTYNELAIDAKQLHTDIQEYFGSATEEWREWSLPQRFPSPFPIDRSASVRNLSNLVSTVPGWGSPRVRSRPTAETVTPCRPSRIDIYPTKPVAFLWNSLRCAWLQLLRAMIDLQLLATDRVVPNLPDLPSIESLYMNVSARIDDICASVPYFLGDVDQNGELCTIDCSRTAGPWLIWLLHRLCVIPSLDPGLRMWIVAILERIGNHGLRRATFLARIHADVSSP